MVTKNGLFYFLDLFVACIPIIHILLFYSFIDKAEDLIGYIPSYGNPDPKTLGMNEQMDWIYLSMFLVLVGSFYLIIRLLVRMFLIGLKGRNLDGLLITNVVFYFLAIIHFFASPFIYWFLD